MKKIIFIILLLLLMPSIYGVTNSAIIVLGCGILENKSTSRVLKAIDECSAQPRYIIFSGRGLNNITEAEFLINLYYKYNTNCLAIPLLEENSYTTISNSLNIMNILAEKNITHATIVTSKNHFYASIIFNAAKILKNVPVTLQYRFSEYTNND